MDSSRFLLRWLVVLVLIALLPGVLVKIPARAQGPEGTIEDLALRAHVQDLRTYAYTNWIGGALGDPANAPAKSVTGQKLENWTFKGMMGDSDVTPASLTRPVLLNFWASWCEPCRLEFPGVVKIATASEPYAFDVIFVNVFDTPGAAQAFLGMYPDSIHTVVDPQDQLANNSGVESIPTSVLLNTDGTVLVEHTGMMTPTLAAFMSAVAANPGVGHFVAADHADVKPEAVLAPVNVDTATPILYDEVATGTITDQDFQHAYVFDGHAGDSVKIDLKGVQTELDPYLVLMAADGTRLGENDDIDPGVIRDSTLTVTLPASGKYIIVATRFLESEGFGGGDYRLILSLLTGQGQPTPTPTPLPPGGETPTPTPAAPSSGDHTLAYGATVTGTLNDSQYEERWTFAGQRGESISLVMKRTVDEPGGLDGYMILQGPDGSTLQEVDDANESIMPALENYALPADGTYTVVATRFGFVNGFSAGEYTLTLTKTGAPSVAAVQGVTESSARWVAAGTLPPGLRRIAYNEPVQGTISSDDFEDWYIFRGRAGDVITLRMPATQGDLDPYLILTDAAGYELARNDDASSGSHDAAITDFKLPVDGRYMIRATRYGFGNGPSSGSYTLTIKTQAAPVEAGSAEIPVAALVYGESAAGSLSQDQPTARYTFAGKAGDVVTIDVERADGSLDPSLVLYDPDGKKLASSDKWLSPAEARISRFALPAAGIYALDVQLEDFTTTGSYRVLLLSEPAAAPAQGAFQPAEGLDIEAVLIWSSKTDLDLSVIEPASSPAYQVTARANDFCTALSSAPVERIVWAQGTASAGLYTIQVSYRFNCTGQNEPVSFVLALVKHGKVEFVGGTLAGEGDTYSTLLEYAP